MTQKKGLPMLLFVAFEAAAVLYSGAYILHCRKKKKLLGAFGAWLMALFSLVMGVLLAIFVV